MNESKEWIRLLSVQGLDKGIVRIGFGRVRLGLSYC